MSIFLTILSFVLGIYFIIYFAEKLVSGVIGTSIGLGISAFLVSVIFVGFDPENLAVGSVASYDKVYGIATGSIIGATMVAVALALGITAIFAPLKFERVPKRILAVPITAVLLFGFLSSDGNLSRNDGIILFIGYIITVIYLLWLNKKGFNIVSEKETRESIVSAGELGKWRSLILLIGSLIGISIGSELLINSSKTIINFLGLSDTVFGMTILAFLVSIEELARELPAALKGKPEISFGNVVGSILAFFLFNAGIIAIIHPIKLNSTVLQFYYPMSLLTVLTVSVFMLFKKINRLAGAMLILLYLIFVTGSWIL